MVLYHEILPNRSKTRSLCVCRLAILETVGIEIDKSKLVVLARPRVNDSSGSVSIFLSKCRSLNGDVWLHVRPRGRSDAPFTKLAQLKHAHAGKASLQILVRNDRFLSSIYALGYPNSHGFDVLVDRIRACNQDSLLR